MARNKNYEQLGQENALLRQFLAIYSSHRVDCAVFADAKNSCTCRYFDRAQALAIALKDPAAAAVLRDTLERDAQETVTR